MIVIYLFYTITLEALYFLLSPILFTLFRFKPGSERLAIDYPKKHYKILVHAASVGEINGIRQLLVELLQSNPDLNILLTANTKTGRKAAQKLHSRLDAVLSPLDVFHLRKKQLSRTRPDMILIAETEIWPTMLFVARLHKIPVVFVNARMSDKTLNKYMAYNSLLKWLGQSIRTIFTQTEADSDRWSQIFGSKCIVTGNLKFSVIQPDFDTAALRQEWGYHSIDKIIVLGSSRPGEEALLLSCFESLKEDFPPLKLIIAPRHLDRMSEIKALFSGKNVSFFSLNESAKEIHVIDEMGHLLPAYALCDIAVIGGSFYPFGGHNPLEAAFYSKVIIMGPHHSSCQGSVDQLKAADAIIISKTEDLCNDLHDVLTKPERYYERGIKAKQVLEDNRSSLEKHLHVIRQYLEG